MEKTDQELIPKWLGITEQQFSILTTIQNLELKDIETTPKNIGEEHSKTSGKKIKTPNLFAILKTLTEAGLVVKEDNANYRIDFEGLKKALSEKETQFLEEVNEFKRVSSNIEDRFKAVSRRTVKPYVEYLEGRRELFNVLNKYLERATRYYIVARFPGTAFTPQISRKGAERGPYLDILYDRCFDKKDLHITYLTPLAIDYPFNYALLAYRNPHLAYRECEMVLNNLENQVEAHENLDVRYVDNPFGFDVVIPEMDEPLNFFIWVRDRKNILTGGIHIRSPETTLHAKEQFLRVCKDAKRVRGEEGQRILKKVRTDLKKQYGKHK
jgi:hypothetical protein